MVCLEVGGRSPDKLLTNPLHPPDRQTRCLPYSGLTVRGQWVPVLVGEAQMNTNNVVRALRRGAALLALALGAATTAAAGQVELKLDLGQEALLAGESHKLFIKVGLTGLPLPPRSGRPPINVALVLDRSGSMQGEKLEHARRAALLALDYLGPDDIVSVVAYDHTVEVLVPATRLSDRQQVADAIRAIEAGGNTALFAGVSKGAAELRKFADRKRIDRMVLLSDGLANVGPSTPAELGRLGRQLGGEGMSVTTIGLGLGYNEDLMVRLAGASDGNHVFAERPNELAGVFRSEFGELSTVVAQQVVITLHCRDGVRPLRVLGREAEIVGQQVTAQINQLYAEQEKYLLLEVEVAPGRADQERPIAEVKLQYDDLGSHRTERLQQQASLRYTASPAVANESVQREVAISATEQLGAKLDEDAIELKDKGDVAGAQALFRQKSELLEQEAERYDAPKLREQSEKARAAEQAVAAPAVEWERKRKEVREEQFSTQKQQSWR